MVYYLLAATQGGRCFLQCFGRYWCYTILRLLYSSFTKLLIQSSWSRVAWYWSKIKILSVPHCCKCIIGSFITCLTILDHFWQIYQFFILLECSSKNCVLCSNLASSIISVRRLKLCHRNIFFLKEMKGSRAILSDCALFKRVPLLSSVRCLVLKAIKFIS